MRSTVLLLPLAFVACSSDSSSGVPAALLWVENLQGTDASSVRMVVGPNDLLTIAAYNTGAITLTGEATDQLGHTGGPPVLLLARFRDGPSGGLEHLWSKAFDGTFDTTARIGLAVTPNGDVALGLANLDGTITLDGATLIDPRIGGVPGGVVALFAGADGAHLWSKSLVIDRHSAVPSDLAIDPTAASVIVAGTAQQVYDAGGVLLDPPGNPQLYVAALELADGAALYARAFGSSPRTRGTRLFRDVNGELLVTGDFQGTLFLNHMMNAASPADDSTFIAKLEGETGEPLWATNTGLPSYGPLAVSGDSLGNALIAGNFFAEDPNANPAAPLDRPNSVATVLMLDGAEGRPLWHWRLGDGLAEAAVTATSVAVDSTNSVIVGGSFRGRVVVNGRYLKAESADALFVVKLAPEGAPLWGRYSGGTGNVAASDVRAGRADNVYASGVFELVPAQPTDPAPDEVFVIKLAP